MLYIYNIYVCSLSFNARFGSLGVKHSCNFISFKGSFTSVFYKPFLSGMKGNWLRGGRQVLDLLKNMLQQDNLHCPHLINCTDFLFCTNSTTLPWCKLASFVLFAVIPYTKSQANPSCTSMRQKMAFSKSPLGLSLLLPSSSVIPVQTNDILGVWLILTTFFLKTNLPTDPKAELMKLAGST